MKKKLTLNKTWKLCLKQWKWIIKQLDSGSTKDIAVLKEEWMRLFWQGEIPEADCFFCQYDNEHKSFEVMYCSACPGKLVSKRFHCENRTYDYHKKPRAFYRKLLELDKKRKMRK